MWDLRRPLSRSGWTLETLLEYINARIADMELRQQQRFVAQQEAINAAIVAQRAAVDAALIAADRATSKAEKASELRFESVNEFRQTLSDQAAQFITRTEVLAGQNRNTERIQDLAKRVDLCANRNAVLAEYDRVMTQVNTISEQQTLIRGRGSGIQASWAILVAVITILIGLGALYLAMK